MRVALLTREYPPDVYGGAGVHVAYLGRELSGLEDVTVHKWGEAGAGDGRAKVVGHEAWEALQGAEPHMAALRAVSIDLTMAAGAANAEVVHSHTWYANFGGHLAKLLYGIPHVATAHSLEPLPPWKAEQLGGGYALSSGGGPSRSVVTSSAPYEVPESPDLTMFCERTAIENADAVIAVSRGMGEDILACYPAVDPDRVHVIYNGIDTEEYSPDPRTDVLERHGVDPGRPSVVFVGRITRQKGVEHLLEAAGSFDPAAQLVLCAGAPDTPELGAEVARRVDGLKAQRDGVIWIDEMLPKPDIIQLLSHATVSACPSIYEPLGIVNLEAMACEAAVVATATGGIVEVVVDGETGLLVPFEPSDDGVRTPVDPRDSPQLSRSASMRWCGIPSGRRRWARPGGSACSSISRGRRSPSRLRRSTGKSPESPSRSAMRLSASVPGPATARPAAAA